MSERCTSKLRVQINSLRQQTTHGLRTPNEAFLRKTPKLSCLGRQFGQINFGALQAF